MAGMECLGHTWTKLDDNCNPDTWHTLAYERFHVLTWPFGPDFHQAKVVVEYPHAQGEHTCCKGIKSVGVGLSGGKTQYEAMQVALDWVVQYMKNGPPTAEEEIAKCYKEYPDLHKTRADVLESMWFMSGGGYDWLDGAVFYVDQGPPPDFSHMEGIADRLDGIRQKVWDMLPEEERGLHPELAPDGPEPTERPLPDDKEPRDWGRIDQGFFACTLLRIPPDIRPEWLASAREAARLLEYRSINPEHTELGKRVFNELCPQNLDEAFEALDKMLHPQDREDLQTTDDPKTMMARIHHSLGRHIRNAWGLWTDSPLAQHLKSEHGVEHPDDMSGHILTQYMRVRYPTAWDRINED